jgi:predicted nucleic-acid-binding protein
VIDANVILRYLLADHPEHFQLATDFMEQVQSGETKAFIPEGVIVECVYVLLKFYGVPRTEIVASLTGLLHYKGVINDNKSILASGLQLFQERKVDIVDAIIYAISLERGWPIFSFDKDLQKLR